jgi:hypothetical protein
MGVYENGSRGDLLRPRASNPLKCPITVLCFMDESFVTPKKVDALRGPFTVFECPGREFLPFVHFKIHCVHFVDEENQSPNLNAAVC